MKKRKEKRNLSTESKMVIGWMIIATILGALGALGLFMLLVGLSNCLDVPMMSTTIYVVGGLAFTVVGICGEKFIITRLVDKQYIESVDDWFCK